MAATGPADDFAEFFQAPDGGGVLCFARGGREVTFVTPPSGGRMWFVARQSSPRSRRAGVVESVEGANNLIRWALGGEWVETGFKVG